MVFNWTTISKNKSLYNTLPIFSIWIAGEVIRASLAQYKDKLVGQEEVSNRKAEMIYNVLDSHPDVFKVVPEKNVRSRMNLCFRVRNGDAELEAKLLQGAEKLLLQGIKGHR